MMLAGTRLKHASQGHSLWTRLQRLNDAEQTWQALGESARSDLATLFAVVRAFALAFEIDRADIHICIYKPLISIVMLIWLLLMLDNEVNMPKHGRQRTIHISVHFKSLVQMCSMSHCIDVVMPSTQLQKPAVNMQQTFGITQAHCFAA